VRDELHPQGTEKPEASTRRRGAKRSGVRLSDSEAGFSSIEQFGGVSIASACH